MGGKMSRNKGARGEREVIKLLQVVVDHVYQDKSLTPPKLLRNSLQSAVGGADTICRDRGLDWISVEVKFQESFNFTAWWKQTCEAATSTQVPVLLYRRTRVAWRCRRLATENIDGVPYRTCVDTSLDDFLIWFGKMLAWRLDTLLAEAAKKRQERLEKLRANSLPNE